MNQEFDQILEDDCDFQIEAELYELRKKYIQSKEERKKHAADCQSLENKIKLLTLDEQKITKRQGNEQKLAEERALIQSKLQQQKERIQNHKKALESELQLKKAQIEVMKDNTKNVNTNWKTNLAEKNRSEKDKLKMIREENEKFVNLLKQEEEEKNKQQCIQIKGQIINSLDRRKKLEYEKKLKMKQQLEAKIKEEEDMKRLFEEKIGGMEDQEQTLQEKKKDSLVKSKGSKNKNK